MLSVRAKNATCTEDGNTAYWRCEDCGKYFSDSLGENEISLGDTVIPATGHHPQLVERVEAACTVSGNIAYWHCEGCDGNFADEGATQSLTEEQITIAASGHAWDQGEVTKEPGCVNEGERTYICANCTQTKTESIAALNHDYSVTDYSETEHWKECSRCGDEENGSRAYHAFVTDSSINACDCGAEMVYSQGLEYTYSAEDEGYMVTGAGSLRGQNLFIPHTYNDGTNGEHNVVGISATAFRYESALVFVRLPDCITKIEQDAFFYCTGIEVLSLPEGLERIEDNAFYGCQSLVQITIPASVSYIGEGAFAQCLSLQSATFENPVGWTGGGETVDFGDPAAAAELIIQGKAFSKEERN